MTTILTVIAVVAILAFIGSKAEQRKKRSEKNNNFKYNEDAESDESEKRTIYVTIDPERKRNLDREDIRKRSMLRHRRFNRSNKRKRMWCILRIFIIGYNLETVDNIYQFKAAIRELEDVDNNGSDPNINFDRLHPSKEELQTIIRFLNRKRVNHDCDISYDKHIKYSDYKKALCLIDDRESILLNLYKRMDIYWNDEIAAYVNNAARINRLDYLIERLNSEKQDPLVTPFPHVIYKIDAMLESYKAMILQYT